MAAVVTRQITQIYNFLPPPPLKSASVLAREQNDQLLLRTGTAEHCTGLRSLAVLEFKDITLLQEAGRFFIF